MRKNQDRIRWLFNQKNKLLGFTLIEAMIALSLSLLLTQYLYDYYTRAMHFQSQSLHTSSNIYRINALLDEMANDIQQSGNIGCAKLTANFPFYHDAGSAVPVMLEGNATTLTLAHAGKVQALLLKQMNNNTFTINNEIHFKKDSWILLSDCEQAVLSRITHVNNQMNYQTISILQSLHKPLAPGAELSKFIYHRYHYDPATHYLARQVGRHEKEFILKNIKTFHFHYVVNQGGTIRYVDHFNANTAERLLGIEIKLSLQHDAAIWQRFIVLNHET